jgi:gas vesicle structural protein
VEPVNPERHRLRTRPSAHRRSAISRQRHVSLCETLDRVLNKGAVITGDIIISVADIDLLYLGLNLIVTSVETMRNWDATKRAAP